MTFSSSSVFLLGIILSPIAGAIPASLRGVDNRQVAAGNKLFLMFEASGIDIPDFSGLPDTSSFDAVAIIVPNLSPPGSKTPAKEIAMWESVERLLPKGTKTERWVNLYFGKDGFCPLAKCNAHEPMYCSSSSSGSYSADDCASGIESYMSMYQGYAGISYDDEVGDPSKIVHGMEAFATSHSNVKLGWTYTLRAMSLTSPRSLGKLDWSFSFGQAYTDDTQSLYAPGGCAASLNIWDGIEKSSGMPNGSQRMVPMLCGAGNCQEPPQGYQPGTCIDERLSPQALNRALAARPTSTFANAAVWYGTVAPSTGGLDGNTCKLTSAPGWEKGCVKGIDYS